MSRYRRVNDMIDIEVASVIFYGVSAVALLAIPIDGVMIQWNVSPEIVKQSTNEPSYESPEPINLYLMHFHESHLFGKAAAGGSSAATHESASDRIKDYRLRGIILGDIPEAIIEDARTQKTEFVKIGQSVGEMKVQSISVGSIVLNGSAGEVTMEIQ